MTDDKARRIAEYDPLSHFTIPDSATARFFVRSTAFTRIGLVFSA